MTQQDEVRERKQPLDILAEKIWCSGVMEIHWDDAVALSLKLYDAGYRLIDTDKLTVMSDLEISQRIQQDTSKWAITNKEFLMDCSHIISKAQLAHTIKELGGE